MIKTIQTNKGELGRYSNQKNIQKSRTQSNTNSNSKLKSQIVKISQDTGCRSALVNDSAIQRALNGKSWMLK